MRRENLQCKVARPSKTSSLRWCILFCYVRGLGFSLYFDAVMSLSLSFTPSLLSPTLSLSLKKKYSCLISNLSIGLFHQKEIYSLSRWVLPPKNCQEVTKKKGKSRYEICAENSWPADHRCLHSVVSLGAQPPEAKERAHFQVWRQKWLNLASIAFWFCSFRVDLWHCSR